MEANTVKKVDKQPTIESNSHDKLIIDHYSDLSRIYHIA